ncbi:MAG: hypothetical protein PHP02_07335 [Eubacteriales bacterium]|nr:hypothetical protein [Eubacteriales bacterium]
MLPAVWFFFVLGLAVTAVLMLPGVMRHNTRRRLLTQWGEKPEARRLDEDVLADIGEYHRLRREHMPYSGLVDDTTWRDLDMDTVLSRMNFCQSVAGSEVLHDMLRDTGLDGEALAAREARVSLFETDVASRLECQLALRRVGKASFHGAAQHLFHPDFNTPEHPWRCYLLAVLPLLILLAGFFYPPLLLALIPAFGLNMFIHYRTDMRYHAQGAALRHLGRVLTAGKELAKLRIPGLSPELKQLQEDIHALKGLNRWLPYFQMERVANPSFSFLVDFYKIFLLRDMVCLCKISGQVTKNIDALRRVYRFVGERDAEIAIAAWRSTGAYCKPEFIEEKALKARGLIHPLLENPVANGFNWVSHTLITGSNASGKSTFIKALAVNAILAQTILTCRALSLATCRARVMTAMAVKDNLLAGESYYIAETKALKRINLAADTPGLPLMCLVDEILRGTNTVERIAASVAVLTSFLRKNMLVINATHDVELVTLLQGKYDNYHFSEDMSQSGMCFSYLIQPGPARGRNAIKLLEHLGFDPMIVSQARELAGYYDHNGEWPSP